MSIRSAGAVPAEVVAAGTKTTRQVLIGPDVGPNFALRRFLMEPGGGIPPHTNTVEHEQYVLRGLHYQVEQPQGKLVRVAAGAVFDVAVDLRRGSPTFGRWIGALLSDENKRSLWIPPGFAHGFLVLSSSADFVYKCTAFYAPEHERSVRWDDPEINIEWPLPAGVTPKLSDKDLRAPSFRAADTYP